MKIAFLTTDNREAHRRYQDPEPYFGPAPGAVLEGFAMLANDAQGTINEEQFPLEVHVVSCTQQPLAAPEKIAPNIWYHSLHVPKIGWLRTGYQGCVRAVRRKLREINPDIVHGQGTERDCSISAVLSGYPNVLTIHGNMAELARRFHPGTFGFNWLMARLEDFTLPRTSGVFCNSDYTRSLVIPRSKKTWRVDNPIRAEFFSPMIRSSKQGDRPVLLNVGVVGARKRQLELLRMARRIHRAGCPLELRFIGSCGEEDYAREFLTEVRDAERQGYASYQGSLGLPELLMEMDAASGMCHFPSEEAFGLVVAEGLARNLRFFGSRVGGIPGIVEGIQGADLVDPDDFASLEEEITAWIRSGAPRIHGSDEAMNRRFYPAVIARKHLEIYQEVLSR